MHLLLGCGRFAITDLSPPLFCLSLSFNPQAVKVKTVAIAKTKWRADFIGSGSF
jgi:hypothetical protein